VSEWTPVEGLRVAIDGPSGSGKGTIAAMVGEAIGLAVMDTGLLYRFLGWRANELNIDLSDESAVFSAVDAAVAEMEWRAEGIFFENRDSTPMVRGEDVGAYASEVAALPAIRKVLLNLQRKIAASGCVMDGRDIGTVVLPDAEAKFFLTASQREPARRRCGAVAAERCGSFTRSDCR